MQKLLSTFQLHAFGLMFNTWTLVAPDKATNKMAELFCTPRKGRPTEKAKDFLASATAHKAIQVGDKQIQTYVWEGNGPTILLAHGWESNSARWKSYIHALKKAGFRIVAVDAPAHGNSGGNQFTAIWYGDTLFPICELYQPSIIMGHSAGGMATIYLLSHYQLPYIKKAVILGAPSDVRDIIQRFAGKIGLWERTQKAFISKFEKMFNTSIDYFSIAAFAKKLTIPAIIVHDENDADVPFADGQKIAQNYADSVFIPTKGFGHSLNDTQLIKQIVGHLKSI